MSQTLELPDPIYNDLVAAARDAGTTPVGWIADHLPKQVKPNGIAAPGQLTEEEIAEANARLEQCIISLGHATGIDNERIDADLAREYGDDHATLYRPDGSS
jgi:hypothetical protein